MNSSSNSLPSALKAVTKHNDIVLAAVVIAVICLMVFPVPPLALDILIAINLAASIILLMLSMYIPSALGLSTFPALLLFTTIFRLSLNIASTKQILLHAHAGQIIETFGKLIVGGNVIVGLVVFIIIAIVQFIVIAKGSERVAEVGARFTLDAMPGKQMSIDADVRANLITADEAKQRRSTLELESKLHGSLDGAMKFVKGDAIASVIIAAVNILAGISIGVLMKDMTAAAAVSRYTILAIGDGMVSQIPSLFVSVAAGILITRVAGDEEKASNLGTEIGRQLMAYPMALLISGTVLVGFAIVPGFPKIVFAFLGIVVFALGFGLRRESKKLEGYEQTPMPALRAESTLMIPPFISQLEKSPFAAPLVVQLAPNWNGIVSPHRFNDEILAMRNRVRLDLGLPFPGMAFSFNPALTEHSYAICVHELEARRGHIDPSTLASEGSAETAIVRDLEVALRQHASSFIGMQEVQNLLNSAQTAFPDLCAEVLRALPLQRIAEVMRRLVDENISIRHFREILESLIGWGMREKDVIMLTEYVRIDLGKFIVPAYLSPSKKLHAILLDTELEEVFRQNVQPGGGDQVVIPQDRSERLLTELKQAATQGPPGVKVVLLAAMDIRRYVKRHIADTLPDMAVLSYQEVGTSVMLEAIAQIG